MNAEERGSGEFDLNLDWGPNFVDKLMHVPLDFLMIKSVINEAGLKLKIIDTKDRAHYADCNDINYRCAEIVDKLSEVTEPVGAFITFNNLLDEILNRTPSDDPLSRLHIKSSLASIYSEIIVKDQTIADAVDDLTIHPEHPANFYQKDYAQTDSMSIVACLPYGPNKNWTTIEPQYYVGLTVWRRAD